MHTKGELLLVQLAGIVGVTQIPDVLEVASVQTRLSEDLDGSWGVDQTGVLIVVGLEDLVEQRLLLG